MSGKVWLAYAGFFVYHIELMRMFVYFYIVYVGVLVCMYVRNCALLDKAVVFTVEAIINEYNFETFTKSLTFRCYLINILVIPHWKVISFRWFPWMCALRHSLPPISLYFFHSTFNFFSVSNRQPHYALWMCSSFLNFPIQFNLWLVMRTMISNTFIHRIILINSIPSFDIRSENQRVCKGRNF